MAKTKKQKITAQEKLKKHKISPIKKKALIDLVKLIDQSSTVLLTSSANIPSAQLQKMRQEIKKIGKFRAVKKNLMMKAVEDSKKEGLIELKKFIGANSMIIFSDNDAFELAAMLSQYKYPAKAKSGQISNKDITIDAGPTDLMPGPAITELSNVGLKVGVEGGKIAIKEAHTIVKNGEKISKQVAEVISKLGIMPFTIGLKVIAVYDSKDKKIFANIDINKDEAVKQLVSALINARGFAINIGYPTAETIKRILAKASIEEGAIAKLLNPESANQSESTEQNNQIN